MINLHGIVIAPCFLTLDSGCKSHLDCPTSTACLNGTCLNPCLDEKACGTKAICNVVNEEAVCSCPHCYHGSPYTECIRNETCIRENPESRRVNVSCNSNDDCDDHLYCDVKTNECLDPCTVSSCESNKRCHARKHSKNCICKFGFVLNSDGEFVCAGNNKGCEKNDDCSSELSCTDYQCKDPCGGANLCPIGKSCVVMNHQPVCLCLEECNPSIEICLRDEGCPENLACAHYQCIDPCEGHVCPGDSPCYVEEHKPQCKFCPTDFIIDPVYGCVKGMNCSI